MSCSEKKSFENICYFFGTRLENEGTQNTLRVMDEAGWYEPPPLLRNRGTLGRLQSPHSFTFTRKLENEENLDFLEKKTKNQTRPQRITRFPDFLSQIQGKQRGFRERRPGTKSLLERGTLTLFALAFYFGPHDRGGP